MKEKQRNETERHGVVGRAHAFSAPVFYLSVLFGVVVRVFIQGGCSGFYIVIGPSQS